MSFKKNVFLQPETLRDWQFGPVSGHRTRVVFLLLGFLFILYVIQVFLWPQREEPQNLIELLWSWGSVLWIAPTIFCSFGIIGLLMYKHPKNLDKTEPIDKLVVFRIVSRGINVEALTATIKRCQAEMNKNPLFNYYIEVVTDAENVSLKVTDEKIIHIKVPKEYQTSNNSLYKARALHYALHHSSAPSDAWIVHLDEETQPTPSGIRGICSMISEEEKLKTYRIGQGVILYHREWKKYPLLTLADNVRTGIDFGQFHLQQKLGLIFFGFHGSYIVVRNSVEKSVGFDFGPNGSITEDAFWGLVAMEKGYRLRWVEGYMEEQSTQSIPDFIKQRRRWMQGLIKVVLHAPVHPKWKVVLGFNILMWNIGPFASIYTVAHFFFGFNHAWWITFLANYSYSSSVLIYAVGLKANSDEFGIKNHFKKTGWYLTQITLFPYFSLLESVGVLAAIFKPVSGFHVVKK